ncbi:MULTISPECIES: ComEA family DNA-binding protein [Streptomycetaceae]|uniref:DNA-binding protein n=1 Tax=Streptantibioticus cattleyicolor (strain ATCC 35852 / DSM 46488 / JCM 4925 / NBRC 14057 / NRRL 8057) TaxID=1003195 RepID=F8JP34_STREN
MEPRTVVALAGVLVVVVAFAVHHFWAGRPRTVQVPAVVRGGAPVVARAAGASEGTAARATATVVVDVAGRVRRPGVARLPAGSRVVDALKAAGGAVPGTDTGALNLARLLVDGEQIRVGGPAPPDAPPDPAVGPAGPSAATGSVPGAGPVSLSTATLEQLDALPGVGPVLARHILDYRTQHGPFTSVTQLRRIPGVGDRRYKTLEPLVRP